MQAILLKAISGLKWLCLALCLLITASCKSQDVDAIDLAQLDLTVAQSELYQEVRAEGPSTSAPIAGYEDYRAYDNARLLNFNGQRLTGGIGDALWGTNYVAFAFDPETAFILYLDLVTYTERETDKLITASFDLLGDPDFTSFDDRDQKALGNPSAYAWEAGENHYFLSVRPQTVGGLETRVGRMTVVKTASLFEDANFLMSGTFQYYGSYFTYRARQNEPDLTYQEFAERRIADGNDYYGYTTE